jgi:sugar lactone lactonase YvrE
MWLLFACRVPEPEGRAPFDPEPPASTVHTGDSSSSGDPHTGAPSGSTGHTGAPEPWVRPAFCEDFPVTLLSQTVYEIQTTEDFDFDADGRLVFVDWNGNYMGATIDEEVELISPRDSPLNDARGVQVLSTGMTAINYINENKIISVDPATGNRSNLLVGPQGPNALEVGDNDVIYFTETFMGRVARFETTTGLVEVLATGFTYPNGLTLSPDQKTLYVSDDTAGIFRLVLDDVTGTWGSPELVVDPVAGDAFDAMETDECGNLYSAGFDTGVVYRYDPYADLATLVVELDPTVAFKFNSMRWGANRGGWRRDTLYVTDRNQIYGLELGVNGRNQPVDLLP